MVMDKLILNGKMYSIDTLSSLPDHLRLEKVATASNDKTVIFVITERLLSNHYLCEFTVEHTIYNCMTQYIMKRKALHFDDKDIECKVMLAINPNVQKGLGKKVAGFVKEDGIRRCQLC